MLHLRVLSSLLLTGLCTAVPSAGDKPPDPDRIFTPQETFISAASEGLGGAGCALPWNVQSVFANPALLYSCRNGAASVSRSAAFGYGRDSLFDRYIVPVGMSYVRQRNAVAVGFRALSSSAGLDEYEATATLCRRVWGSADEIGPVDLGANIRFAYADGKRSSFDTLATVFSFETPSGAKTRPDSIVRDGLPPASGMFREDRLLLDLGFFKPEIAENIDFGLTIKNLAGFFWGIEAPDTIKSAGTVGTVQDTVTVVRTSAGYGGGSRRYAGMVPGKYAVFSAGLNYRFPAAENDISFCFPADVDFYGLLDRKVKQVAAFHLGVQAHFSREFFLRIGYSLAPSILPADFQTIPLINNVSFGASILPPGLPVAIDCYFSHYDWGMNAAVDY